MLTKIVIIIGTRFYSYFIFLVCCMAAIWNDSRGRAYAGNHGQRQYDARQKRCMFRIISNEICHPEVHLLLTMCR